MHVRNLLNVKQELLYQCNPITVVTIIAEYHNTIYSECGLAKCNKIDQWDAATGVRVAKRRALRKIERAIEKDEFDMLVAKVRKCRSKLKQLSSFTPRQYA